MSTNLMTTYVAPIAMEESAAVIETNDVPVFVAAAGWVALIFGSAFAYCKAMCGWNNVKSCSTSWLQVKATCKK